MEIKLKLEFSHNSLQHLPGMMNTNYIVTPYTNSVQIIATGALRCTHTTVKLSSRKLEPQEALMLQRSLFIYSHDAQPLLYGLIESLVTRLPMQRKKTMDHNTWCIKLFKTADHIHYLQYFAKGDKCWYNNLQKFTHSNPPKITSLILYNCIHYCFI